MTDTKHTPGPWHIGVRQPTSDKFIYGQNGEEIADCDMINNFPENNLANARLIAAAPTMASRIQGAIDCLSQNKVFPADIEHAKSLLIDALERAGITETGLDRFEKAEGR